MSGLLETAGFNLPDSQPPMPQQATATVRNSGSLLEAAGFNVGGAPMAADVAADSWKDREARDALEAQGISTTAPQPKKPGRGMAQALWDYLPHVASGVVDTIQAPGNIAASKQPTSTAEMVGPGLGIASLVTGPKYPARAASMAAERAGTSQAVNRLVDLIEPENVSAAVDRLRSNPRLALADVSDPVRTAAQGLIDPAQPKAQNALASAVKERVRSAPDAVNSAYTEAMGPAPDVVKMVEGLKERARTAGREAIRPALENAKPVDVSPVIAAIDEKVQPGLQAMLNPKSQLPLSELQQELLRVKQQLTTGTGETLFDAQRLHRVQSDLGDQAFQLTKSPNPKDRLLGSQLRDLNEKLIDQIDEAADGAYRPAREKFKDAKDIHEAFDGGFDTLKNRAGVKGLEDRPEALAEWMKMATPEQVVAKRLGTRADIDQKINGVKNGALAGETITRIEYNKNKLRTLFGETEANRLIRGMEDAHDMATTNGKILANSKTAETLAAQRALEVPKVTGGNPMAMLGPIAAELLSSGAGLPGVGFAASMASRGAYAGVQKLSQMNALARNAEIAKAAMATGPERNLLMDRLLAHPRVKRAATP